ncbi:hypothetical protein [Adhaeribacter pallidiroseus]|uniref:Uncharacterized protein n=1 Tax=Adhaeribacter pallidiroseus TaxID=2072847 RepID=A0A369QD34_9BACT|nr:hypothetical protein [Adhaeribacter pallidiroseus]RDC62823.1 hypothetical protein AHMF7616_01417 [Adhaeribacter pallidiroseus]
MLLHAGPVQALYDRGFLRYIQIADHEIVRMIYFAVRDQDWQTMAGSIRGEHIQTTPDTFSISYTSHINQDAIQMEWQVSISGRADGTITFDIEGTAQSNFLKNRAGFCVLHPIAGISGHSCRLEHPDGSASYGQFPTYISPHQPFLNIKAMEWPVAEQGLFRLEFSGDIFETEDQRNWSDASFKTYCTPLSQPFPAPVNAGDQIKQQVIFKIVKPFPISVTPSPTALLLLIEKDKIAFPEIGFGLNTSGAYITPEEAISLRSVGSKHLRADIFLNESGWKEQLEQAGLQSEQLNAALELVLFFGKEPAVEVGNFVHYLQEQRLPIKSLVLLEAARQFTTDTLLQTIVPVLRTAFPGIPLGGGSNTNFTELNRNPFTFSFVDFVSYPVNPQVHAFDDLTLIENAAAQADTVKSAQHLAGHLPVHVSPVTLKPRLHEVATSGQSYNTPPDPRQPSSLIAGWTLASLKYLGEAGATAITYFETTGPKGIYHSGKLFPTGYLFQFLQQYQPQYIVPTTYTKPLEVTPLLLLNATGSCLLLANHSPDLQAITLPAHFTVHTHTLIGEDTGSKIYADYLPGQQITLKAYQVVALEGALGI